MEEGLNSFIRDYFGIEKRDIRTYSPLALAYIGDAVYDLVVRSVVTDGANTQVNQLHKKAVRHVSAKAQSLALKSLEGELSDQEADIVRRGRNTKMHTTAKNASLKEYREATGFEALLGYLYLTDNVDRLFYIIKKAMEKDI